MRQCQCCGLLPPPLCSLVRWSPHSFAHPPSGGSPPPAPPSALDFRIAVVLNRAKARAFTVNVMCSACTCNHDTLYASWNLTISARPSSFQRECPLSHQDVRVPGSAPHCATWCNPFKKKKWNVVFYNMESITISIFHLHGMRATFKGYTSL